jgi:transcriptional regulator with XRE-family HTH domain
MTPQPPTDGERRAKHGERLKRERSERDLSQEAVASAVGMAQPLVSKAEKGYGSEETFRALHSFYRLRDNYPSAPKDPVERRAWIDRRNEQIRSYRPKQATIGKGIPGSALRKVD